MKTIKAIALVGAIMIGLAGTGRAQDTGELMILSPFLTLFYGVDMPTYWEWVENAYDQGCIVYEFVYVSCPGMTPNPPWTQPVPWDATITLPPAAPSSRKQPNARRR